MQSAGRLGEHPGFGHRAVMLACTQRLRSGTAAAEVAVVGGEARRLAGAGMVGAG